ncbi:fungal-specific transcription factor domain-containing protein [Mycena filopes]|nr:fungal-specific transcription factor domain-containing protein [Mycena filopes]
MSENQEDSGNVASRKRKGHRPCDMCRQKKRRCDGETPCAHCVQHTLHCSYQRRAMQRVSTASRYVHSLEDRLKSAEALLRESSPHSSLGSPTPQVEKPGMFMVIRVARRLNTPLSMPLPDDPSPTKLSESLQSLSIDNPSDQGFQGRSSQAMLIKAVVDLKSQTIPPPIPTPRTRIPPSFAPWSINPWENAPPTPDYAFPPTELMLALISNFFSHVNVFLPIFHRPTFDKTFMAKQHLCDDGFARTLLLICALGARYSDDPRVHLPDIENTHGWKWFSQVQLTVSRQPTLYDLQCYCLAAQFLDRASGIRAAWTLVGVGLRLGQDLGAHRSKFSLVTLTPSQELERRTYWALVLLDAQYCIVLGRSIGIQAHDFDLDPPLQCDDEYWEATALNAAFHQPTGMPSVADYFACQLTLNRVLSFTLKCLYCNNRMRATMGITTIEDEEKIVVELDSALNRWADSVPAHLRWDPTREADIFSDQAAALSLNAHLTRIVIHRPLIPAIRPAARPSGLPSLTICNQAARAISRIADLQHARSPQNPLPFGQTAVFTAGIVLLLNIWGANRNQNRTPRAHEADLADAHRCIAVLRAQKERNLTAAPLADTLEQLVKSERAAAPLRSKDSGRGSGSANPPASSSSTTETHLPWPAYDPALETLNENTPTSAPDPLSFPYPYPDAFFFNVLPAEISDFGADTERNVEMDTAALWSAAPLGFEVSDWDLYLNDTIPS